MKAPWLTVMGKAALGAYCLSRWVEAQQLIAVAEERP